MTTEAATSVRAERGRRGRSRSRRTAIHAVVCSVFAATVGAAGSDADAARTSVPRENGKIAFVSVRDGGGDEIYVMNADGTNQTRLTYSPPGGFATMPDFSPDGTKIVYASNADGNGGEIWVMNADGTDQTRLTNLPDTTFAWMPRFSPDGTKIVYSGGSDIDIYVMNVDGTNQTRLTTDPDIDYWPVFSPDGTKIAFQSTRDGKSEIYLMNADGTSQTRITAIPDYYAAEPDFSPDGARIVFWAQHESAGDVDLFTIDTDGGNVTRLTSSPVTETHPSFSPDGTQIAYEVRCCADTGPVGIFVLDIASGGVTQIVDSRFEGFDTLPDWGPAPAAGDTVRPVVSGVPARPPDANGWYRAPVVIDWQAVDPEPSSGLPGDPPDTLAATEGAGVVYESEPSCDPAGNCATGTLSLSIDSTPPTITCQTPAPVFLVGSSVGEIVSASVTDGLSGSIAGALLAVADTSAVGEKTVVFTAYDLAGNEATRACGYRVEYKFSGFLPPVGNPPDVNLVTAGQVVALRWRLTDASGAPVTALTDASVTSVTRDCELGTTRDDAVTEQVAGSSGLQSLGDGYFQLNWKTPRRYVGSCRTLRLDLGEGGMRTALVDFR